MWINNYLIRGVVLVRICFMGVVSLNGLKRAVVVVVLFVGMLSTTLEGENRGDEEKLSFVGGISVAIPVHLYG